MSTSTVVTQRKDIPMYSGSLSQPAPSNQTARDNTELEGLINTLRGQLFDAHTGVRAIYMRVMPPTPEKATAGTVSPVANTYAQRIQELINAANDLRDLVSELNGRI